MADTKEYKVRVYTSKYYWTLKKKKFDNLEDCIAYGTSIEASYVTDPTIEIKKSTSFKDYLGFDVLEKVDIKHTFANGNVVYTSTFREKIIKYFEDQAQKEREKQKKKEEDYKHRRERILQSWGITEEDIEKKNIARLAESKINPRVIIKAKDELTKAKKVLSDLIFNHEELIAKAKEEIAKKTKDLDDVLDNPGYFTYFSKEDNRLVTIKLSQENLSKLWDEAGGKDKWNTINLKKVGPFKPVTNSEN